MDDLAIALNQSVRKKLSNVRGVFYVPPEGAESSSSHLLELYLTLDASEFHFSCAADGETLAITRARQQAANLGKYGEIEQKNLSGTDIFKRLMNTLLLRVHYLKTTDNSRIGVKLEFNDGLLILCNWGDDLKVWDKIPEALFASEQIKIG